jgi:ribosomal protein S12
MRLILESGANCCYENLLTSNKVIALIPNEYTNVSRRDLVLIVREASRERPQMRIVNVTHVAYMPLYYILLFLYSNPG